MCKHTKTFTEREMASFGKGHAVGCEEGRRLGRLEMIEMQARQQMFFYPEKIGYGACKKVAIPDGATPNEILAVIEAAQTEVR